MAESTTPQTEVLPSSVPLPPENLVYSPTLVISENKSQDFDAHLLKNLLTNKFLRKRKQVKSCLCRLFVIIKRGKLIRAYARWCFDDLLTSAETWSSAEYESRPVVKSASQLLQLSASEGW
uniref:Uncharacterized protein n=1 Tax=Solanum tuberosum TaxID=4113 RepID=M1DLZ2_SOLTU